MSILHQYISMYRNTVYCYFTVLLTVCLNAENTARLSKWFSIMLHFSLFPLYMANNCLFPHIGPLPTVTDCSLHTVGAVRALLLFQKDLF